MYLIPQPYTCPKCNDKFQWSPHEDSLSLGKPYCPKCFFEFIDKNIPKGICDIECLRNKG